MLWRRENKVGAGAEWGGRKRERGEERTGKERRGVINDDCEDDGQGG